MRKILVSASVVVHVAAIAALMILAFWRIDKLPLEDRPVRAAFAMPGMPAPAGGQKQKPLTPKKDPPRVKTTDTVQPPVKPTEPQVDTGASSSTDETTDGTGDGPVDGPGTGITDTTDEGTCTNPPCDGEEPPVVAKKPIPKKVVTIAPNIANGLRTSGNEQIHAPEATRVTMLHEGKTQVVATAKVCIGDDGRIDSVSLLKSTGYAEYDSKITGEMRLWRYDPYRVNGEAVPFCTAVTIVYKMRK